MNPLVVDKIRKTFLWEKDSGFLYTKQLIASLPLDWRFTILVPKKFDCDFFRTEDSILTGRNNIECVEYDYSTSIHQNRYHFNRNIISKALPYTKDIDVVLNMQPEVSANLRVFFFNQRREIPIIINYFHWIDCEESRKFGNSLGGFIWRQVEGAFNADLNLFHNETAQRYFYKSMTQSALMTDIGDVRFFHPQPTNFGTKEYSMKIAEGRKKIIVFNHRLNNTTGWREILGVFLEMYREGRDDFVLWFTDESNLKDKIYLESIPFVKVETIPFENYGYFLNKCHFSVCNTKEYATWNMAVLDSQHYGTEVVSCDTPLMREFRTFTTNDFEKTFNLFLDMNKVQSHKPELKDFDLEKYVIQQIGYKVRSAKTPLKYDKVVDMIKSRSGTSKKDFVNEFWSFHANSNFQKIRWKLLYDGFVDDTTSGTTLYRTLINP